MSNFSHLITNALLTFGIFPIALFDTCTRFILFMIIPAALMEGCAGGVRSHIHLGFTGTAGPAVPAHSSHWQSWSSEWDHAGMKVEARSRSKFDPGLGRAYENLSDLQTGM